MPSGHRVELPDGTKFSTCICCEFDCDPIYAKTRGISCCGEFWKEESGCLFYGEHLELNNIEEQNEEKQL